MTHAIIRRNYERGLWNAMQVQTAVLAGVITQAQAEAIITGTRPPTDMSVIDEAFAILRGDAENINPGTLTQPQYAQFATMRKAMDGYVAAIAAEPALVNEYLPILRSWQPGTANAPVTYTRDVDVRVYNGFPYLCCQTHTHHGEPNWEPDKTASLWREYHGTSVATARPYRAPSGAHDIYRAGEYMIWMDGTVYHCLVDTDRGPDVLPNKWEAVT